MRRFTLVCVCALVALTQLCVAEPSLSALAGVTGRFHRAGLLEINSDAASATSTKKLDSVFEGGVRMEAIEVHHDDTGDTSVVNVPVHTLDIEPVHVRFADPAPAANTNTNAAAAAPAAAPAANNAAAAKQEKPEEKEDDERIPFRTLMYVALGIIIFIFILFIFRKHIPTVIHWIEVGLYSLFMALWFPIKYFIVFLKFIGYPVKECFLGCWTNIYEYYHPYAIVS